MMKNDPVYSTKQAAEILHVSKGTIYELIKRGELNSYKVGRNIRFSQEDIDNYINHSRNIQESCVKKRFARNDLIFEGIRSEKEFVICGQDVILDVLSNYMRLNSVPALRAYVGSFESLLSLYQDRVDVASAHLWASDTGEYNIPFVKRLLPGIHTVIVHLTDRMQGFYVAKGNPENINSWSDLRRSDIKIINRERGSGSRVLLDGHLQLLGISGHDVNGYENETTSHLTVASAVSRGEADAGLGSEKIGRQVEGIDFIPMQKESYDIVIKKDMWESNEVKVLMKILTSDEFRNEFKNIGGYDVSEMGKIIAET